MSRPGLNKGQLRFRLAISLGGLALIAVAYANPGSAGTASPGIALLGAGLFGGFALWCAWQLWKAPRE